MDTAVQELFARYARLTAQALSGQVDNEGLATLYASEFIAATPTGVMAGRNDQALAQTMSAGFDHYRRIGTRAMVIRALDLTRLDDLHGVVRVGWSATYARADLPETVIDFDVHYLVQVIDGCARVFGWVSGDEQAVLRNHGVI